MLVRRRFPELARRDDVDCVLVAIVGAAGLEASHAALTSNKRLALANKGVPRCRR